MTNAINKNEVSMFKVGKYVVLNKSQHQNRVMKIEMFHEEFIRAYQIDSSNYSFAHMSNFRLATPEEIAAGHRIDLKPSNSMELENLRDCDTSPNCKKFDERVK
ncbi:hypothetical protein [Acinetobacter sp. TUM15509]|uniref:hypothetical protein n=1 Tax=Acinetobacter sp. TUM15509 TaxID=2609154 RepID=UPI00125D1260|nr:hypothetical protein [Acinetobacter sp. TUM15509]